MATNTEIKAFIKTFGQLAVAECNRRIAQGKGFVLPSVCMAQSALESDWGQAGLMKRANAFFGVKATGSTNAYWKGKVYTADTREVVDGESYRTVANFRAYDSPADSMADYYELTVNAPRYSKAVSYGADSSKWLSPRETVTALWAGGYATDDLYVQKVMNTLNGRNLDEWDAKIDGTSTEFNTEPDYTYQESDFKQGILTIQDSGRTIGNVTSVTTAVALDWAKAFTATKETTYKIEGLQAVYVIRLARITGDSPTIEQREYANGDTFTVQAGEKVGFYITYVGGAPADLSIDEINVESLVFKNTSGLFAGIDFDSVDKDEALAFFVKIH